MSDERDIPTIELNGKEWHIESCSFDQGLEHAPREEGDGGVRYQRSGYDSVQVELAEVDGFGAVEADLDFHDAEGLAKLVWSKIVEALKEAEDS